MLDFFQNFSWIAVGQIVLIDLLLGGDNAILIALACRNLPEELRLKGILWGTAGAILIRIVLITFAVTLLQVPLIKLVGGAMLLWIGVKLLLDQNEDHSEVAASSKLAGAIKTIIIADLVMSIDNVMGIASVAEHAGGEHQLLLVIIGILISIPIVVWGSTLVLKIMDKLPFIVILGAGLLGYLGGAMIISDVVAATWLTTNLPPVALHIEVFSRSLSTPGLVAAIAIVGLGLLLSRRVVSAN